MKLTDSEKQAVAKGETIRLIEDGIPVVVLRADIFEQSRELIYTDIPLTEQEKWEALKQAGERAGWNDPEMDVYNDLDPRNSV